MGGNLTIIQSEGPCPSQAGLIASYSRLVFAGFYQSVWLGRS